jgi:hypothetical protein
MMIKAARLRKDVIWFVRDVKCQDHAVSQDHGSDEPFVVGVCYQPVTPFPQLVVRFEHEQGSGADSSLVKRGGNRVVDERRSLYDFARCRINRDV